MMYTDWIKYSYRSKIRGNRDLAYRLSPDFPQKFVKRTRYRSRSLFTRCSSSIKQNSDGEDLVKHITNYG